MFGQAANALLDGAPGETAISDKVKNRDINDMYNFTMSSAIVLHCVTLRFPEAELDEGCSTIRYGFADDRGYDLPS